MAIGEVADFTLPKWRRVKQIDGKPTVSGKFLSELWLGTLPVQIYPLGIKISGVHIDGAVSVYGARSGGGLHRPLPRFNIKHSVFSNGLDVSEARCETIYATDCVFHQLPPGEFYQEGDVLSAIHASATEVVGMFGFLQCTINGQLDLTNSVIDDDLGIYECTVAESIECSNAEIRGNTHFQLSRFLNQSGAASSILMVGMECRATVMFGDCRMSGPLDLSLMIAQSLYLERVRVQNGGINCLASHLSDGAILIACRVDGELSLNRTRATGGIAIASTVIGKHAQPANVDVQGIEAEFIRIEKSVVRGAIHASMARCKAHVALSHLRVGSDIADSYSFHTEKLSASHVNISDCTFSGHVGGGHVNCTELHVADIYIGLVGSVYRIGSNRNVDLSTTETNKFGKLFFPLMKIAGYAVIERAAVSGGADFAYAKAGAGVTVKYCWLGTPDLSTSLSAVGVRVNTILNVTTSLLPSGLDICTSEIGELQIYSSRISQGLATSRISASSIWASEARFVRAIFIGRVPQLDGAGIDSYLDGMVDLSSARIDGYASFSGATIKHRKSDATQVVAAIDLSNSQIPALMLGIGRKRGSRHDGPLSFFGAVAADGAEIGVMYLGDGLSLASLQPSAEASLSPQGEAVITHKQGVAFSGRALKVMRFFQLRQLDVTGIVDLRDSAIANLQDQGGIGWGKAGVSPGQLLLDGMRYTGLDDDEGQNAGSVSDMQRTDSVARRLAWLDMQYADNKPTAASFTPQPYEQLASHYAAGGDERARRQVLVRKRQLQRLHSGLGWTERQVSGLLGLTSDYGYSPGKASLCTLGLLALGTIAAWALYSAGGFVPANNDAPPMLFSAPLYAMDVAIPFVEFGYDSRWQIDPTRLGAFWGRDTLILFTEAIYRLASFVLLSITVLTYSGVLRDKD